MTEGEEATGQIDGDEEMKELLEENLEVAQENNKLLKRMYRNSIIALVAKVLIWLIILGVPLFFLAPYLKPFFSFVTTGEMPEGTGTQRVFGVPSASELQQLLETYTGNSNLSQ